MKRPFRADAAVLLAAAIDEEGARSTAPSSMAACTSRASEGRAMNDDAYPAVFVFLGKSAR
ncbi:hypothetical protein O1M63_43725 [Streptomyces mirabilis]|nr:hypothetical protein [Streptomyces mirabilis]